MRFGLSFLIVMSMIGIGKIASGQTLPTSSRIDSLSPKAASDTTPTTFATSFGGFMDAYLAYDFDRPTFHERAPWIYNHSRTNEFNVNLVLLTAKYADEGVRGAVSLMAGTYAQYNTVAEQGLLKNIYEANAGFKVKKGLNLWVDAGVFPSYIGYESVISADNPTLTRSVVAENTPYYLTGARAIYYPSKRWQLALYVINGWQNIREASGNSNKPIGWHIQYKSKDERLLVNSSSFVGQEKPDSMPQMRYYHNAYAAFKPNPRWTLALNFDIGAEQTPDRKDYNVWFTPLAIARYAWNKRWAVVARVENYQDRQGVIVGVGNAGTPEATYRGTGLEVTGTAIGFDYAPDAPILGQTGRVLARTELRYFRSPNAIFRGGESFDPQQNFTLTTSLSFRL
jgi:hypothetical protein